ncbi:hypothetical protein [Achromobacter pestifer]
MRNAVHLRASDEDGVMPSLKDETLSIRTSAEIKQLLRLAADRERRSVASMIEILVLEYARRHDLRLGLPIGDPKKASD